MPTKAQEEIVFQAGVPDASVMALAASGRWVDPRAAPMRAGRSRMIAVDNRTRAGVAAGVIFGVHLCRANFRGRWLASGGYDPIAEQLFNDLSFDRFLLEYDSARAGDFCALRFVPPGKIV